MVEIIYLDGIQQKQNKYLRQTTFSVSLYHSFTTT